MSLSYGMHAIEACTKQCVPNYVAGGQLSSGCGTALACGFREDMRELKAGLESYRALGAARNVPPYLMF